MVQERYAISGATSSSYTTAATQLSDNGASYTVLVTNSAGSIASNGATLTVNAVAPTITTQPANQSVTAGATATFSVVASGTAPLTYQWSKGGTAIGGATAASYTTPATVLSDNGSTFTVVVTNSGGSKTSLAATLTVAAPVVAPTITTQPANQSVTAGATATFSVVASGTAPLTYQWSKGGTAISGATAASYTTPATVLSDKRLHLHRGGDQFRRQQDQLGRRRSLSCRRWSHRPSPHNPRARAYSWAARRHFRWWRAAPRR